MSQATPGMSDSIQIYSLEEQQGDDSYNQANQRQGHSNVSDGRESSVECCIVHAAFWINSGANILNGMHKLNINIGKNERQVIASIKRM